MMEDENMSPKKKEISDEITEIGTIEKENEIFSPRQKK
jgi:hypothetical protein